MIVQLCTANEKLHSCAGMKLIEAS